jgi:hypothetical protein
MKRLVSYTETVFLHYIAESVFYTTLHALLHYTILPS